jgi:hypothetical protein
MHNNTTSKTSNAKFDTLHALWNLRDDRTLTASEVRVANALIAYMDAKGESFPSIRTIAATARMRTETVTDALLKLEARTGPIVFKVARAKDDKHQPPKRDANGHIAHNVYQLSPGIGWNNYSGSQCGSGVLADHTPVLPKRDPSTPDRDWPVRIRSTEEDSLKKTLKEERELPLVSSKLAETRAANSQTIEPRPWYTAEAIQFAKDKYLDPVKVADAFTACSKPKTEKSFKSYIFSEVESRAAKITSGELVYSSGLQRYVTPQQLAQHKIWIETRDKQMLVINAGLDRMSAENRSAIIAMINAGTHLPRDAYDTQKAIHEARMKKTGTS